MSRNQIYFAIIELPTRVEYHVSASQDDVLEGDAFSRGINKPANPFGVDHYIKKWRKEAELYGAIELMNVTKVKVNRAAAQKKIG